MKKQLLLGSALLAFAFAGAQTVQNIPNTTALLLEGAYSVISDAAQAEGESGPTVGVQPDGKTSVTTNGVKESMPDMVYFSNFKEGDSFRIGLKSEQESCYIIKFAIACKTDAPGSWGQVSILNKDTEAVEWTTKYEAAPVATASYGFTGTEMYVETPIPAGEHIFEIVFHNDNGSEMNTFSIGNFVFEGRESITQFALYTYCEPAEAGSIVLSPSQPTYLEGAEIKAQAVANSGYKFVGWDNGIDDVFTTNPYTFEIYDVTDLTAMFEEVLMYSNVPGQLLFENRILINPKNGTVQYDSHQIKYWNAETQAYDILNPGEPGTVPWLGNYRNGESEMLELNATQAGVYNFVFNWSLKTNVDGENTLTPSITFSIYDKDDYDTDSSSATPEWTETFAPTEATTQWFCFREHKYDEINLTEGHKYLLMEFKEPVANKYTINLIDMKMGIGDNYGEDGGEQDAVEIVTNDADAPVRAYNLQGIEVAPTTKGLIIVNGQKVYNK